MMYHSIAGKGHELEIVHMDERELIADIIKREP